MVCLLRSDMGFAGDVMCRWVWGCALVGNTHAFARGDGGGVVMPLFCVCFCGVSIVFVLGGEVWGLLGRSELSVPRGIL